ncbi:hypothetical protein MRY82_07620 [bacterium]|nr:hypothetical protein [bacterium]
MNKQNKKNIKHWMNHNDPKKMNDISRRKFIQSVGMFLGTLGLPGLVRYEVMEDFSKKLFGSSLAFAQTGASTPVMFWYNISVTIAGKLDALMTFNSDASTYGSNDLNRDTHFAANNAIVSPGSLINAPGVFSPEMNSVANSFSDYMSYMVGDRNTSHAFSGSTISIMQTGQSNTSATFPVAFINQRNDIIADINSIFDFSDVWELNGAGPYSSGFTSKVRTLELLLRQFEQLNIATNAGTVLNEPFVNALSAINLGFKNSVLKLIEDKHHSSFNDIMSNIETLLRLNKRALLEENLAAAQTLSNGITKPSFGTISLEQRNIDPFVAGRLAANMAANKASMGLNVEIDNFDPHIFVDSTQGNVAFGQTTRGTAVRAGGVANGRFFQQFADYMSQVIFDTLSYAQSIDDPDIPGNSVLDRMLITITNDCNRGPDLADDPNANTGDSFGGGTAANVDQKGIEMIVVASPTAFKNGSLASMDNNFNYLGFDPVSQNFMSSGNTVAQLRNSLADLLGVDIVAAGGDLSNSIMVRV